jgi:CTP synthase (EC 6.3.4.2)
MDSADIYAVPLDYHREGLDTEVLAHFGLTDAPKPDLAGWEEIVDRRLRPDGEVTVAVVGKIHGAEGCL